MPPKKKNVNLPSAPPPVYTPTPEREREFLRANELYIIAGAQSMALRNSVRAALIAGSLEVTDESVAYLAKKMVEKDGASLLDEIEAMKGLARRIFR